MSPDYTEIHACLARRMAAMHDCTWDRIEHVNWLVAALSILPAGSRRGEIGGGGGVRAAADVAALCVVFLAEVFLE